MLLFCNFLVRPHTVKMIYPEGVVNEGSEILIQCFAVGGKPSPNIRWFMAGMVEIRNYVIYNV